MAECTLHLFLSSDWYLPKMPISINGKKAFDMSGDHIKKTMTGDMYQKSYIKCDFPDEEKLLISYDITWAGVPYHEEISINLEEDEDVYLKLYMPGMMEAISKGRNCFQFKLLTEKEGKKEIKKVEKGKYTVNPPYKAPQL